MKKNNNALFFVWDEMFSAAFSTVWSQQSVIYKVLIHRKAQQNKYAEEEGTLFFLISFPQWTATFVRTKSGSIR